MKDQEYREFESRIRDHLRIYLNEHYCIFDNPVRSILVERSNALTYRTAAIQWNLNNLKSTVHNAAHAIFSKGRSEIYPTAVSYGFPISFSFDDVIFNLVSMIDYLAGLLIVAITGNGSKNINWNSLQKTMRNDDHGYPKTAELIVHIHNTWVNRLAEYRAGVYHNSNEFGVIEHWFDFEDGADKIAFYLPDAAIKQLPAFNKGDKIDLIIGTEHLIEETFQRAENVIQTCYLEKPKRVTEKT